MKRLRYILLIFPLLSFAQQGQPDYLLIDEDSFAFVYKETDSVRIYLSEVEEHNLTLEHFRSYASIDELKDKSYWEPEALYPASAFGKFPAIEAESTFGFMGDDQEYILEFLDDSHYRIYAYYDHGGGHYSGATQEIARYRVLNFESFDLLAFFAGDPWNEGVFYAVNSKESGLVFASTDEDLELQDMYLRNIKDSVVNRQDYTRIQGYYTQSKGGKLGVVDHILGEEILPAKYDSIDFHKDIHVWQDGKFGIYDYKGRPILPVEYRGYMPAKWSNPLSFLDFDSRLYTLDRRNQLQAMAKPGREEFYANMQPKKDTSFYKLFYENDRLIVGLDYATMLGGTIRLDSLSVEFTAQYEDFFFDSRDKRMYISHIMGFFGRKPSGKLDLFRINIYDKVVGYKRDIDDFYHVINFIRSEHTGQYGAELILIQNGLHRLPDSVDYRSSYKYKQVFYAVGQFYRVQFQDGRLGWATFMGQEYPDPD